MQIPRFALPLGFEALLFLDWSLARQELAPARWMKLRVLLTVLVFLFLTLL
jgi:hypothetical protein